MEVIRLICPLNLDQKTVKKCLSLTASGKTRSSCWAHRERSCDPPEPGGPDALQSHPHSDCIWWSQPMWTISRSTLELQPTYSTLMWSTYFLFWLLKLEYSLLVEEMSSFSSRHERRYSGREIASFNVSEGLKSEPFSDCGFHSAGHDAGRTPSMLKFQQGIPDRSVYDIRNERVPFLLMADAQWAN